MINEQDVSPDPDPDKTRAIMELKQPNNVAEVRCYLGMLNHFFKFVPDMSSKTKANLRKILLKCHKWAQ